MNQNVKSVHLVYGAPSFIVDGFKVSHSSNNSNEKYYYFLTHFHSDHYTGLVAEKHKHPIVCSTITSNLIQQELGINKDLIIIIDPNQTIEVDNIKITAMDANHCPGALLLLFQLPNGDHHLHCGDMRYKSAFKQYAPLQNIKIAKLYLDTTYAHARHDFIPQEKAIDRIVEISSKFMKQYNDGIICLQAYTIGKEKLITAVSEKLNQPAYVDERKMKILGQLGEPYSNNKNVNQKLFTHDQISSRIHVVKMGFGGQMWPYFQPDYQGPEVYLEKLRKQGMIAKKVLVVIPTGWATATNWNAKNAVSSKDNVTIHLIPYSEHSNFEELKEFCKFIKPREIVPTVFKDENQRRAIHKMFNDLIDHTAAKRNFFSMFSGSNGDSTSSGGNTNKSYRIGSTPPAVAPPAPVVMSSFYKEALEAAQKGNQGIIDLT